mgnify:CR=1 FL=1
MAEIATLDLQRFFAALQQPAAPAAPDATEATPDAAQERWTDLDPNLLTGVAALVCNIEPVNGRLPGGRIHQLLLSLDRCITAQLNEILHHPDFQAMESVWRDLEGLISAANFRAQVRIDFLDASKEELYEDLEAGSVDVTETLPFRKLYLEEYDQFGGEPYGAMIGFYEFNSTPQDILWLRQIGKIAALSHAPFLASVSPSFFGFDTAEQLGAARDLEGLLKQRRYAAWHALRESPEAIYLGLVLPRYLARAPWSPDLETAEPPEFPFVEDVGSDGSGYLWGNAASLFARNMLRAFEQTGWCQTIRGPHGGGLRAGLPAHKFWVGTEPVLKSPVEIAIPDWAELTYANAGFIPLLDRPGTDEACFFSCQSIRLPRRYRNELDTERSQLRSNLAYTLSASRIAHYLKCIVRDAVGSTADASYLQELLKQWLEGYVTTIDSPSDRTLRFYPFKGARVVVEKAEGVVGKFNCLVAVSPHIQFEGIDVELRLESRIG